MSRKRKVTAAQGGMNGQIFMVGTGGQGILLLSRALARIAVQEGKPVIASETHGMAMRGGTVTANLKIGDYAGPLIPAGSADLLIGLDDAEASAFLYMLGKGGISIVNTGEEGPFDHAIDATGMALKAGMPGSVNMIMLGFVTRILGIPLEEARRVIEELSPSRTLEDNLEAMTAGYRYTLQRSS
ncbi:MAG TPA: 2-oxoacid:acceptor oxidoreductase family protein [Deltaproteobacteria bacterium]|jgi:indolepyruvate ferredoxin oxidoreductase beta subunit|nr:2-oxoacid:acceptor oxidoreductase family protein [Deltaproteobacteria bacterium]HQI00498.1 2-oxoacid:acceptor oxidoreductase family protein [Deltaproteobacteria bacterium]HQJ08822.1 2-oxoacid:acceptor oxidoreductase family protein [Deltaproteobacteria bacterium]